LIFQRLGPRGLAAVPFPVKPKEIIVKAHIVSFIKSPIGYFFNFIAHFGGGRFVCWGCETFCLRDGVQDDCWF
jgi:hypothetical protein